MTFISENFFDKYVCNIKSQEKGRKVYILTIRLHCLHDSERPWKSRVQVNVSLLRKFQPSDGSYDSYSSKVARPKHILFRATTEIVNCISKKLSKTLILLNAVKTETKPD